MRKYFLVPAVLLLAGFYVSAQQNKKPGAAQSPDYKIPPEAVNQANPVKPSDESLAHAKKIWGFDCAMCHGANGDGKGDVAVDAKWKLQDYRDPDALKDRTDGELFYIIKNGKGAMPAEGSRAKTNEIWDLVNYIRAFAKKEAPAKGSASSQ